MAYLITHFWPGGTDEQYRATLAAAHPAGGGLPDGQIHHAAGPTDGGYLIAAVWESKEHFERFLQEKLIGAGQIEGGFQGAPEERTAEVANLERA
jgi:hypothetical protein